MKNNHPTKKLGEVCDFRVIKNTEFLQYVGMEDVESNTGKFIGSKEYRRMKSTTAYFDKSCVLYGKLRPYLNKVFVPNFDGHSSTEFVTLRANLNVLSREWLAHWLRSAEVVEEMSVNVTGTRMPRADLNYLKEIEIPLPPLAEQKKIVAKIEKLMAKIDEAKKLRAQALADTKNLLPSALHKIFSEGKKKGWEEKEIQEISKVGTGATPLKSNHEYYGGNVPWVTSKSTSFWYIDKADDYITDLAVKNTNCKIFPVHTLVVAMYGQGKTRGQVSELMIEATTNQALATFVVNESYAQVGFVKYFLLLNYEKMRMLSEGGPQLNLNLGKLKTMKIPLPPLAEQKKIVKYLDSLSAKARHLQTLQTKTAQDLATLQTSILHKAFIGEL